MILLYLSSSMKLTSEIYRDQLRMMDNLGRWIWMVIISIHLVIRGRNVSRAMITKAATIVMAQKEKTRKKLWMRYLLSYLLIIKADDVTPSVSVFCLLFSFFSLSLGFISKKIMGNSNSNHQQRGPVS